MDRQLLYTAWQGFYSGYSDAEALSLIEGRVSFIVGKMMRLALYPGKVYKGFPKRSLETALGMSLGVHKQLLWRLTSSPRAG